MPRLVEEYPSLPVPPGRTGGSIQFFATALIKQLSDILSRFGYRINRVLPKDGSEAMTGALPLTDGITAPATIAGQALIYVDTSDGDLKVKFGDGTVKTIATDT